jgi:cytochrome P450
MIHNPQVQDKMLQEIMEVTGDVRLPLIADRDKMPYCEAVVSEVLRMGNIAPLSLPHMTSHEFTVAGYKIPQNTTLIPCLSSHTRDPDLFPNPDKFDPDRFLTSDGLSTEKDQVLAFSLGRSTIYCVHAGKTIVYRNIVDISVSCFLYAGNVWLILSIC